MKSSFFKLQKADRRGLYYRMILIETLVIVLPLCSLAFILYDQNITFEVYHLLIIAFILMLVLCGMLILRQIISRLLSVVVMVRPTEAGVVRATLRDDLTEIREIEQAFGDLVGKLEKSTADLNRRSMELLTIRELIDVAKTSLDLDSLQNLTLEKVMSVTGARIASFMVLDAPAGRLRITAARGPDDVPEKDISIPLEDSPARLAVAEKKAVLVENIESDPRIRRPNNPRYGSPSFICLPILAGNEVVAVVNLAGKPTGKIFDEDDEKIASIMIREMDFAFGNARLHMKVKEHLREIEEKNLALQRDIGKRKEQVR